MPEIAAPGEKPEPRPSTLVVTGETRTEFMQHRMDLKAPPKAAEPSEVPKETPKETPNAEDATAPTPAPEDKNAALQDAGAELDEAMAEEKKAQPDPKKKQKIRERLSELTAKLKAAEQKATAETARAAKAEAEAAAAKAAPPPAEIELVEPQRAAYQSEEAYQDARVELGVRKALAAERKAAAEARARAEGERVVNTYAERLRAVKAEVPDYDQRIEPVKDLGVPPYIRDAIFESDVGPRLPLYFADHPDDARRIIALHPGAALREIGKIEAMLESAAKPKTELKATVAPAPALSGAPAPISPLRPTGAADAQPKIDAAGKFTGTFAEWKAARRAGKI